MKANGDGGAGAGAEDEKHTNGGKNGGNNENQINKSATPPSPKANNNAKASRMPGSGVLSQ